MPRGVPRDKSIQRRILHRLKIARGHLNQVIKMTESGDYCIDIALQSRAVQKALGQVDNLVLENHLKTCVVEHIKKGEAEVTIEEVLKVVRSQT